jgi:hypothetical protein
MAGGWERGWGEACGMNPLLLDVGADYRIGSAIVPE